MHADGSIARPIPTRPTRLELEADIAPASWFAAGAIRLAPEESDWLEGEADSFPIPSEDDAWDLPFGAARLGIP